MSSIDERGGHVGARHGLAALRDLRAANVFGAAARFGVDAELSRVAVHVHGARRPLPGPTWASACPNVGERLRGRRQAREHRRGARIAPPTMTTSPATRRRSSLAAAGARSGRSRAACEPRLRAQQVDRGEQHRAQSSAILTSSALPYDVCPQRRERRQVEQRRADPRRDRAPSTEKSATLEKRGTATASPATRRCPRQRGPQHEQPDEPADPQGARRRGASSRVRARGRAARSGPRGPTSPGRSSIGRRRASAPASASSSATDRCSRSGRSTRIASPAATTNRREAQLEVEVAPAERRDRASAARSRPRRTPSGARTPRSPSRRRPAPRRARPRRRSRTRSTRRAASVPGTRRTTGRAIDRSRSTKSPSAAIMREEHEPARGHEPRLGGASREMRRDHELRRRPRVRPDRERERAAHRVAVHRDRAPVDEVPALRAGPGAAGRASVSASAGERRRRPGRLAGGRPRR